MATTNSPLTINLPGPLAKRLEDEAVKKGVEKSMLLMSAAYAAVINPPKLPDQEDSIQVSFRVSTALRQKLAKVAREKEASISQIMVESLKHQLDEKPW